MKLCKDCMKVFTVAAAMCLPLAACDDQTTASASSYPAADDAGAMYDAGDVVDVGNVEDASTDGGSTDAAGDAALPDGAIGGGPGPRLDRYDVAGRIAEARCERLRACGTLGVPYKYASKEACVNAEHARALEELRGDACTGVTMSAANACIDQATNASCQSMFDPLYLPIIGKCSAALTCSAH